MFLGLLCFQDLETDIVAVWSAMEDLVKKGLVTGQEHRTLQLQHGPDEEDHEQL